MPCTWDEWGVNGYPASTFLGAFPHLETPAHWDPSATFPARHKMRVRFYVDVPGGDTFFADSYFDDVWVNFMATDVAGAVSAWSSTWANAGEMLSFPDGVPMSIPDLDPEKSPRYGPGRHVCVFATINVVCYGIEMGIVLEDSYAAADKRFEYTPRSGATKLYDANRALCSYTVATTILEALNKLVESARWRISGPLLGDR